ncbi:MAG: monofunctional biosynthetic peptidoglycan transglycosylase [Deltaproteobacteria bacterium]
MIETLPRRILKFTLKLGAWSVLLSVLWVASYRFLPPPVTPLMIIRYFENGYGIQKKWKSYDYISENLALAVIASEDQKFFDHSGFDIEAIEKALSRNKRARRIKGASTISQQVAKNVFLWPERSWVRKGFETYFTFLIETLWSKRRILEVYMNVAEMGRGVYGAERAAQNYFGKPAARLTRAQAALIAATLPNPKRMSAARPSGYVLSRQQWILRQMSQLGSIEFLMR